MKTNNSGIAKILQEQEIERLFADGFQNERDRALFGICMLTTCKISEACSMLTGDAYDGKQVRSTVLIRKGKSPNQTIRSIPVHPQLVKILEAYRPQSGQPFLFPGRHGRGHINPRAAALILKAACDQVGLSGISTHSFRRTALTKLASAGVSWQTLQAISGIESLAALEKYLVEREAQVSADSAKLQEGITFLDFRSHSML